MLSSIINTCLQPCTLWWFCTKLSTSNSRCVLWLSCAAVSTLQVITPRGHLRLVQQLQHADAREEQLAAEVEYWRSKACRIQVELNTLKQQHASQALLALLALLQLWQQWGAEQQQELDSTVYAGQVGTVGKPVQRLIPGEHDQHVPK